MQENAKTLSRHVTSLISFFTANEQGFERLIGELEDYITIVSPTKEIVYSSPSFCSLFGSTVEAVNGKQFSDFIHFQDISVIMEAFDNCKEDTNPLIYVRYITPKGPVVCELVVNAHYNHRKQFEFYILSARDYASKASQSIDCLIDLRIENLRLRQQLMKLRSEEIEDQNSLQDQYERIFEDFDDKPKDRKRSKLDMVDLFCYQCGITESPEWRRGPMGLKT
jgi:PAS domain S-box-containing protein